MRKSTKTALLIAFFAQRPSKEDAPFIYSLSCICVSLFLWGLILKWNFMCYVGMGLIIVGPFTKGAVVGFVRNRGTGDRNPYTVLFIYSMVIGITFLVSFGVLFLKLTVISFFFLLAIPIAEGSIERRTKSKSRSF